MSEEKKFCCICELEFNEWGNNPEPFGGAYEAGQCCDDCNEHFVVPVRLMFGRGGRGAPLDLLTKVAAQGAMIRRANKLAREHYERTQAELKANGNRNG